MAERETVKNLKKQSGLDNVVNASVALTIAMFVIVWASGLLAALLKSL